MSYKEVAGSRPSILCAVASISIIISLQILLFAGCTSEGKGSALPNIEKMIIVSSPRNLSDPLPTDIYQLAYVKVSDIGVLSVVPVWPERPDSNLQILRDVVDQISIEPFLKLETEMPDGDKVVTQEVTVSKTDSLYIFAVRSELEDYGFIAEIG